MTSFRDGQKWWHTGEKEGANINSMAPYQNVNKAK
jgi:hypothetical protein